MLTISTLWLFTGGERKIAEEFIILCCRSETNEFVWYKLLQDAPKKEVQKDKFAEMNAASQIYETVSFLSVSKNGSSASLKGNAKTKIGCASKVSVEVLEDKINSIIINPLCPK